ncbi:MAG: tRNA (guanosine(46)-N7)-methyltransferase TrmB [Phycisphaerae bacterium]|nr:tRNA (guanosine(46)-N7)-methyltransferase TrmB [Phycisphaerae bacterium]|tara:strand:+ start:38 stop:694 length:657 start_codon:yes stop_codon:yes gene_type:complete
MKYGMGRRKGEQIEGWGISMKELAVGEPHSVDPRDLFEYPDRSFEIELGSGKGTFLVQQAVKQPETNFLGIEWAAPFYRFAADRLRRHGLSNTKMMHGDGTEFLGYWCADSIADVIHLYFLDPWPKARHHKRRAVQDETMKHFHRLLKSGGLLHLVTDHDDLWQWYQEHIDRASDLFETREFQPPDSAEGDEVVGTNFERKYRIEGRPIHSVTLVRCD